MNPKFIPCLVLALSAMYSAFALANFVQLKPAEMGPSSTILIRSKLAFGSRNFFVALLPEKDWSSSNWVGNLLIYDGTNRLVSCAVESVVLSGIQMKNWRDMMSNERYHAMTNLFSRPLNGAKIFTFEVATNLLVSSEFVLYDRDTPDYTRWFYLKDFANEK